MPQKWISGKEILENLKIQGIELFRLVKKGLEPHDDLQHLKPTPDVVEKTTKLNEIKKKLGEYEVTRTDYGEPEYDAEGNVCRVEEFTYDLKDISDGEYELLKAEFIELELDLNNPDYSWTEYKLPNDKDESISVINELVDSCYSYNEYILIKNKYNFDNIEETNVNIADENNERSEDNQLIWNGRTWEITFQGLRINEMFSYKGIIAISYIIEQAGKSINPINLSRSVNPVSIEKNHEEKFDGSVSCKLSSKDTSVLSVMWKNARKAQDLNIKNAIKNIKKNFECKELASHLSQTIKYSDMDGFHYTGGLEWLIKR